VIAATRETLGATERDRDAARRDAALSIATLQALEDAHRDILDDLIAVRAGHAPSQPVVAGEAPEAGGVPDLTAALVAERETLRASLSAAEDALAQVMARRDGDLSDLRRRISDVADSVMQRERLPPVAAFTLPVPPN